MWVNENEWLTRDCVGEPGDLAKCADHSYSLSTGVLWHRLLQSSLPTKIHNAFHSVLLFLLMIIAAAAVVVVVVIIIPLIMLWTYSFNGYNDVQFFFFVFFKVFNWNSY